MFKHRMRDPWGRRVSWRGPGLTSGAAAFSPLSLPGLLAWYDASVPSSLWQDAARTTPAAAEADPVGSWDDLSGNGRHGTAAGTQRPTLRLAQINGRPSARTDGVDDVLSVPHDAALDATTVTILMAARLSSGSVILEKWINTYTPPRYPYSVRINGTGLQMIAYDGVDLSVATSSQSVTGAWHQMTAARAGDAVSVRVDGAAGGSASLPLGTTTNGLPVGLGGRTTNGELGVAADFGEVILAATISPAHLAAAEAYLKAKWGTP